ncbi:MAG: IS110 family transposase [Sedimentisphaerales bacterium]|nr:IS110 family transposase [Sedimentisphaerales bacterium]
MSYLGIDLHTNSLTVCYRTQRGQERLRTFDLNDLDVFRGTLRKRDRVAVEATGNTRWFVQQIESRVKNVVVVDPNKFEVITRSVSKTDKHDAKTLAYYLSKDMLPKARIKDEQTAQLHSLAETRDKLVKQRTALINKIHNVLNSHGITLKKESLGTQKGLNTIWAWDWPTVVEVELKVLVGQIENLNEAIKRLDDELPRQGRKLKGYAGLSSIKGIGPKSATVLLSVIGNVKDFSDEDKLAAYFGIVPRVSNSNETVHHGRITKRGSKLGRTTLVQCTLVAKRYSPYLRRFYERLKQRRGSGKAIIATARKLLGIIYQTLTNGWIFEDFPNFVLANG